jgi:flagellar basal-body rod modification protein FlgD
MSEIGTTTTTTAADAPIVGTTGSSVERKTGGTLGKDDFLKLMVAQMKQMDPLAEGGSDPSKSMETMTQFSILEQLTNLAASNTELKAQQATSNAVSLIGKTVTYTTETGDPAVGVVESVQTVKGANSLTIGGKAGINPADVLEVK